MFDFGSTCFGLHSPNRDPVESPLRWDIITSVSVDVRGGSFPATFKGLLFV